ncbi:MAG: SEC-C metal-binding domain-containing protein [Firmicutes bacterium]|nr:SEC-C metal-binding domain-containing protein [Bacillota bacterium]
MKPGRNDPCPCGSGKKYKRCCYLKNKNAAGGNGGQPEDGREPLDRAEDGADGISEEQDSWLRLILNLRKISLDRMPHIKAYYRIRKMHEEVVNSMATYIDNGKFKQEEDPGFVYPKNPEKEKTLRLIECSFDFDTREGIQAFYDMQIYKTAPNLTCVTEDFIRSHRYTKPEKTEFLQSMLESKLGLFEITAVDSEEGYAYLKEVFTGAEYKITDVGLSGSDSYGDLYIYTRIVTYRGVSFNSGLNLIFAKKDKFVAEFIRENKKDYSPYGEYVRFTQLYNQFCKFPNKVKFLTNTLR